jgi:hypothetical protein
MKYGRAQHNQTAEEQRNTKHLNRELYGGTRCLELNLSLS